MRIPEVRLRPAVILTLLLLFAQGCQEEESLRIPDRTVVLTFDDGVRNHLTFVAPLLEEHGFGATFFVTQIAMSDPLHYLTWPEFAELHRRGFEVGNHTRGHLDLSVAPIALELPEDCDWMEAQFARHGLPTPTSFAWPTSSFGPEGRRILLERGYRFARRGMRPELPLHLPAPGPVYDPSHNDPLLVPSAEVTSTWTVARFEETVRQAKDGRAVVLQFHGIPDPVNTEMSVTPETFRALLHLLQAGGYRVVALRDLAPWVDPSERTDDPHTLGRWPTRPQVGRGYWTR